METLRKYFTDVGAKYLTKVDVGKQHEIGSNNFTSILGDPKSQKVPYKTVSLYINDESDEPLRTSGVMTWYDTRLMQPHRNAEFRLYYQTSVVSSRMVKGDFCIIALRPDKSLFVIFAPPGSTAERQLRWLFDIGDLPSTGFSLQPVAEQRSVSIVEATILEELGIEPRLDDERWLDNIVGEFGEMFPTTALFSAFARKSCPQKLSPLLAPDATLLSWLEHEEMLFRTLERQIVQKQLDLGFQSVDHFVKFSLSVQNRRKSRIGHALEHHLAAVFTAAKLPFGRQVITENRATADFLFPGQTHYLDESYPSRKLIMLASKSSCKDRWRQVLTEAAKIKKKHLFTLEPAISVHQTNEMQEHEIALVVPQGLVSTYTLGQQGWVMDLQGYIALVKTTLDLS